MSLPSQLYELQQLDSKLQKNRQLTDEITHQLNENSALVTAESELASQKQQLVKWKREQKNTEWDLEDQQEKLNQVNNKLYGGAVQNPKELVNLKHEAENLKGKFGAKEDELLKLMSQVEGMEARVKINSGEFKKLKQEWQQKQEALTQRQIETETVLGNLSKNRQELAQQISSEVLNLYEHIKLTKGQAIAKVAQGKCQGCYITLPTSQWQRAKAGNLVQCSSCNRVLYVE